MFGGCVPHAHDEHEARVDGGFEQAEEEAVGGCAGEVCAGGCGHEHDAPAEGAEAEEFGHGEALEEIARGVLAGEVAEVEDAAWGFVRFELYRCGWGEVT